MAISRDFNTFQILHLLACSCWELKATPFYGSDNPDRKGFDPANKQESCLRVARGSLLVCRISPGDWDYAYAHMAGYNRLTGELHMMIPGHKEVPVWLWHAKTSG